LTMIFHTKIAILAFWCITSCCWTDPTWHYMDGILSHYNHNVL
jgi:hypothetical protein